MVASGWEGRLNFVGEKVLMAAPEANVSSATVLTKYLLLFAIKGSKAVARNFTHPHSPPVGRVV